MTCRFQMATLRSEYPPPIPHNVSGGGFDEKMNSSNFETKPVPISRESSEVSPSTFEATMLPRSSGSEEENLEEGAQAAIKRQERETLSLSVRSVSFGSVTVIDCVSEVLVDSESGAVIDMYLGAYDPEACVREATLCSYEQQRKLEGRAVRKEFSQKCRRTDKEKVALAKMGEYLRRKEQAENNVNSGSDPEDEEVPERPRSRSIYVSQDCCTMCEDEEDETGSSEEKYNSHLEGFDVYDKVLLESEPKITRCCRLS